MLNFEGQKVLITGATGGIGQKTAELFAKQGAIVGLCGRNKEKLEKIASNIDSKTYSFVCDLGNLEEVEKLFEIADTMPAAHDEVIPVRLIFLFVQERISQSFS